ncbi:MAG: hypothetical protein LBR87_03150 [Synergistaceae bacterium]|nr:hypothetical protein [Synergistaceae bacterium]
METLAAVLILSLVAAASLKLTALSQRGLSQARERDELVKDALILQIRASVNPLEKFGASGDVSWTVREASSPLWKDGGIDIGSLGFSGEVAMELEPYKNRTKKWREIEVKRNDKTIVLFLPEHAEAVSSDGSL